VLPDFELDTGIPGMNLFIDLGIRNFTGACGYVHALPYGRNTSRNVFTEVLSEQKGTCSTKHGLLASIAEMHGMEEIHLMVGIFLMSGKTHPKVAPVLEHYGLKVIPEAHAYLRYHDKRYDFTTTKLDISAIEPFIVREQRCEPGQLADWKPMIHRHYLESWLKRQDLAYTIDELWEIREACIRALS